MPRASNIPLRPAGELRPEVAAFAQLMEQKLRENDGKGGWRRCTTAYLSRRAGNELKELRALLRKVQARTNAVAGDSVAIGREAADVANFCMMIADVWGGLEQVSSARRPA